MNSIERDIMKAMDVAYWLGIKIGAIVGIIATIMIGAIIYGVLK